jgi:antitoxin (DNA-binding transcriptional repressor) of toxin-antitoxin stability system
MDDIFSIHAAKTHLSQLLARVEAGEVITIALALDAVQRRVPLQGLAHVGHVPHDERVEALPEVALPARHPGDVRLHRGVAVRPSATNRENYLNLISSVLNAELPRRQAACRLL